MGRARQPERCSERDRAHQTTADHRLPRARTADWQTRGVRT